MIYLIHFNEPYHHARHYMGFCEEGNLESRLERHTSGRGAKLMRAVVAAGIGFKVARTWVNASRDDERKLKNRKEAPRLCPICSQKPYNPKL